MAENTTVCPRKFKFFRILLPGFTSKLPIPQGFTNYFIQDCSSWATILSPLGRAWNVKVHGDTKCLYFGEGWDMFAAAHKLSVGDFLVFNYKGGSVFDVTIFDHSTCERDYSVKNVVAGDKAPAQEENLERTFECFRDQTIRSCSKRTAAMMEQRTIKNPSGREEEESLRQDCKAPEMSEGCNRGPCFKVKIRSYNKYYLEIPSKFRRSNGLSDISQLLLRDPKGRLWPAKLVHVLSSKRSFFSAGWLDFYVSNSLEDGDTCIFGLTKERDEVHVQIRRQGSLDSMKISGDGRRTMRRMHAKVDLVKQTAFEHKASQSIGTSVTNLQFMSTIVRTNLHHGHLNIPKSFLSSVDFSAVHEVVLVDQKSRQWLMNIKRYKSRSTMRVRMDRGWRKFCDENNLELGDVCIFRFKSRVKKATFQVEVIKSPAGAK